MGQRVLVVDDDPTVSDVVRRYLERAGFDRRRWPADGPAALAAFAADRPDLVVLDLMLPGIDGLEVCRRLRADDPDLPVVMLTALGEEADRVLGLELGADDYVTKPFSPRELVLRVQSVLRRVARPPAPPETLVDGDLRVDVARRVAHRGAAAAGADRTRVRPAGVPDAQPRPGVHAARELLEQVWGWTFGDQSTVTVHVRRLREKVEDDPAEPTRILTVWGVGYRYEYGVTSSRSPSSSRSAGRCIVAVAGLLVLRGPLRGRSVTAHIAVLLLVTVLAVLAGMLGAAVGDVHLRPRPATCC